MSSEQPTPTSTFYASLFPGDTLRIGPDIIVSARNGKLKITAPKSLKIERVPAKPIDMGDANGHN